MYKCENCGQEFDSNFCPNCGQKRREDKICPDCKAVLKSTVRFCPECGHSFVAPVPESVEEVKKEVVTKIEQPPAKIARKENPDKSALVGKICLYLKYVPSAVFALFAVLLFAFFAGPIAVMPGGEMMGEKIPSESYGNLYAAYSGKAFELADFQPAAIAMFIFAVFALIIAAAAVAAMFVKIAKFKRVNLFGYKVKLSSFLAGTGYFFYFMAFIIGCVACGKISALDGGMGMIKAGACPILLIVFSLIFALLSVGAFVAISILSKKFPAVFAAEKAAEQKYAAEKAARKARLVAPRPPQTVEEVEKPVPPEFARKIIKARRTTGLFTIPFVAIVACSWSLIYDEGLVNVLLSVSPATFLIVFLTGGLSPVNKLSHRLSSGWVYNDKILIASVVFLALAEIPTCALFVIQEFELEGALFDDMWYIYSGWGSLTEAREALIVVLVYLSILLVLGLIMFIYGLVALKRLKRARKNAEFNLQLNEYFVNFNAYSINKKQLALNYKQEKEYKRNFALYSQGVDYIDASPFKKWFYTHKVFIVFLAVVVVIGIIISIALPPSLNPADIPQDYFGF